jgi:hypothetical protein
MHIFVFVQYYSFFSFLGRLQKESFHELLQSFTKMIIVYRGVFDVFQSSVNFCVIVFIVSAVRIYQIHHVIPE